MRSELTRRKRSSLWGTRHRWGFKSAPLAHEERLGIVGPTSEGRVLHVVFTLRDGKVRPISARPAHKKERELYEAYLREI